MSDVSKTNELIEKLALAAEDAAGGPPSAEQVDALIEYADALRDALEAATRVHVQGEPNDAVKAVIDRDVAIDAIAGGTISVPGGYGVLHGDDAANIVDAIIGHATVPDAATEGDYHEGIEEGIKIGRAERDAAVAAIGRIREAVSGHPECDRYSEDDVISCGWKSAYASVVAALDGAPEPEWEYGVQYIPPSVIAGEPVKCGSERDARLAVRGTSEPIRLLRRRPKVVHPAGPWIPVEGEKP